MVTTPSVEPESTASAADISVNDAADTAQPLLKSAWERHEVYSKNATNAQRRFLAVERLITLLGVLVVVLAVAQPVVLSQIVQAFGAEVLDDIHNQLPQTLVRQYPLLASLNFLLIVLPITMTALRAFAVKFNRGNSWVLLRGNAESLKMEIFYYRTRVKRYKANRHAELAEKMQLISERLKGSVVHQKALYPYEDQQHSQLKLGVVLRLGKWVLTWAHRFVNSCWEFLFQFKEEADNPPQDPNRYADLDPDGYIKYRLEDQFDWYRRKARSYDRQHQVLQTSVYAFSGLGTLLAAIGFQSWVAVTAALAAALINYLEYRRVEVTLVGYNQAADALYDIRAWWYSLAPAQQAAPQKFEKLVVNTEETIRSEHNSWLQDMQDRLANLYEAERDRPEQDTAALIGNGVPSLPHSPLGPPVAPTGLQPDIDPPSSPEPTPGEPDVDADLS
ncbi:DUF4231 domain-containing protein [Nodosilinea sp. P-1105]|uniref:DUF4231 domain-containing protein n=1 Tax=Nodosilinea sp. P-1105 TaxID=2546229 RepID=UPI00146A9AB9